MESTYKRISLQEVSKGKYIVTLNERKEENNYKLSQLESSIEEGFTGATNKIDHLINTYQLDDEVIISINELEYDFDQCTVKEWNTNDFDYVEWSKGIHTN